MNTCIFTGKVDHGKSHYAPRFEVEKLDYGVVRYKKVGFFDSSIGKAVKYAACILAGLTVAGYIVYKAGVFNQETGENSKKSRIETIVDAQKKAIE